MCYCLMCGRVGVNESRSQNGVYGMLVSMDEYGERMSESLFFGVMNAYHVCPACSWNAREYG